ncbi:hypothetical protein F5Y15DRAFT_186905 [Xylariaceae sp. FL0016]|nr:hypothetical protein F5Y15DRAFT_186905 [Xylariaceae sp. FL0016]
MDSQRRRTVGSSSTASSVMSGGMSSVFSQETSGTSYTGTVYTAEPDPIHSYPVGGDVYDPILICEFIGLLHCPERFHYNEQDVWIEHIIADHLGGKLPKVVACWFCDEWIYDSAEEHANGDVRKNFNFRMWHVRDHLMEGYNEGHIRPDYNMLKHLRNHKLIDQKRYDRAMEYLDRGVPRVEGIYDANFVPESEILAHQRDTQVIHTEERRKHRGHREHREHRGHREHRSRR